MFFYQTVAHWLGFITDWTEVWNQPIAFILVVIITSILIQIPGNWLLRHIPKDIHRRRVNRIFGLNPQFGRVGIGILDGGRRGLMITQNFRN